jgi:hypothetical protein
MSVPQAELASLSTRVLKTIEDAILEEEQKQD